MVEKCQDALILDQLAYCVVQAVTGNQGTHGECERERDTRERVLAHGGCGGEGPGWPRRGAGTGSIQLPM